MVIEHQKLILLRWLLVFCAVLAPLYFLPQLLNDMKIAGMLRKDRLEGSLTFTYTGNRTVRCYTENPSDPEGTSYVFFPSYADMEQIGVDTAACRVDFVKQDTIITVKSSEHSVCCFETGTAYEARFYNSFGRQIGKKSIVFLKSGGMPTMYITTRTGSMESLDADKNYKEKAFLEFLDETGKVLYADDLKTISGRGNHTFSFEKKSYQINLKKPEDFLGMGKGDKWILLCNVYDPAYIRNKLTYDLALQAGMPGSPRSEYVDVYFNNAYAGLYQLTEKIQIGENRLEIPDLEAQNRELNGKVLDYNERFLSADGRQKGIVLSRIPEDITGGYLIEHDYGEKYDESVSGFITDTEEHFSLQNPAHASREEVAYISGLMQEIEAAIRSPDGCHPVTGKHFTQYIDLESWADKYIVEEFTRNNGGGSTSSYFYKPTDSVSEKVFGGPVWDYDKAYGRVAGYNENPRDLGFMTLHLEYTSWFYYLYRHEEFVEAVKKEYREKFSDYLALMADQKADEYLERIEAAAVLDRARFAHVYSGYGASAMDYRAQAGYVKEFIRERKAFLDEIWLQDAPVYMVHFQDENGEGNRCLGVRAGECIQRLPEGRMDAAEFGGWVITDTGRMLTTQTPITREITVREKRIPSNENN